MKLWIRSQNMEELAKPLSLYICAETNDIWADLGFGHKTCFGIYATKERALEVLDEINEIKYYKYMASLDWTSFASSVLKPKPIEEQKLLLAMMNTYVMPKE